MKSEDGEVGGGRKGREGREGRGCQLSHQQGQP